MARTDDNNAAEQVDALIEQAARGARTTALADPLRDASAGDVVEAELQEELVEAVADLASASARRKQLGAALSLLRPASEAPADRAKALRSLLDGASDDDRAALRALLLGKPKRALKGNDPDLELAKDWRDGGYPYRYLLRRSSYERDKFRLQVELLKLQAWVKETGQRVVILFEGRDAAGKGGSIKRFTEHLNPRGARVVAL